MLVNAIHQLRILLISSIQKFQMSKLSILQFQTEDFERLENKFL
jgi:hypothetical protein